jgi:hypothetical protein
LFKTVAPTSTSVIRTCEDVTVQEEPPSGGAEAFEVIAPDVVPFDPDDVDWIVLEEPAPDARPELPQATAASAQVDATAIAAENADRVTQAALRDSIFPPMVASSAGATTERHVA